MRVFCKLEADGQLAPAVKSCCSSARTASCPPLRDSWRSVTRMTRTFPAPRYAPANSGTSTANRSSVETAAGTGSIAVRTDLCERPFIGSRRPSFGGGVGSSLLQAVSTTAIKPIEIAIRNM